MSMFHYKILNSNGKETECAVEAVSDADARILLRRRGLIPLRIANVGISPGTRKWNLLGHGRFDLYTFTSRLHPLLAANIPLEKALSVMEDGKASQKEGEVLHRLRKGLHEGKAFSSLTKEMPEYFPMLYSSLLETGEEAGCLPEVTGELRRFLKESKEFKEFVVTSSIYPVIVISVTLLVVILLFTVFIPRFAKIFEDMGRALPLMTRIMLEIGNFMQTCWFIWPILIAGLIYLHKASRKGKLKEWKDHFSLRIPIFGSLISTVQMGHFIRTLSILVKNDVHLLTAVKIAKQVIENEVVKAGFSGLENELRSGTRLSTSLSANPFTPRGSISMVKIAEESGDLGEMLCRIADELEEETRVRVKRLLALLEPIVILLLAVIVLAVVLSIFLAIMEMNVIK